MAYELLANTYPYADSNSDDALLPLAICKGLRPDIDKILIPQLLKDLIKKCWNADPLQRPSAGELYEILNNWVGSTIAPFAPITHKEFSQYYEEIKKNEGVNESSFSDYKTHPKTVYHSKLINTKEITQQLEKLKNVEEYHTQTLEELTLDDLNLETKIEIPPKY